MVLQFLDILSNYHLKIIGDCILRKISYVLKSALVWSLNVCKESIQTNQHRIQNSPFENYLVQSCR